MLMLYVYWFFIEYIEEWPNRIYGFILTNIYELIVPFYDWTSNWNLGIKIRIQIY